jgi:cyclopropane-fatty-acyl-phospholipid synthase
MVRMAERAGERAADGVVAGLWRRLAAEGHELALRLWDGRTLGPDTAPWRLVLHHPWSLRAMLTGPGDLAAGEAYLDGTIDVEGSMVAALRDVASLVETRRRPWERAWLMGSMLRLPAAPARSHGDGRARLHGRRHSRDRDAAAVRHHYDVGNDFYRLFLGSSMVYSCAVFSEADRSRPVADPDELTRAQERKLDLVCRKLHLVEGQRLLDVGCGWGSLVLHAAARYGVRALGVTLSEPQARLARRRVRDAGLEDRVSIEVRDYREVTGRFDAIASVGMVEHVGADQLGRYAARLRDLLVPGGRLLNHGITTGGRDVVRDFARDTDSFVARYVFPDGALVPARTTITEIERSGLELWDVQQLRPHYARTLEHWVAALEERADEAIALVGERTYRVWRAYMAGSSVSFERNALGVVQVLAVKPPTGLPFGRAWMEPAT